MTTIIVRCDLTFELDLNQDRPSGKMNQRAKYLR